MRAQPFESVSSALLEGVERLVVEEHRVLFAEVLSQPWSRPVAYRWIRYEDPDPIGQLIAASERLDEEWGRHPEVAAQREAFRAWERVELERLLGTAGN
jgi:hypothetical protein